jgi:hypothetical protein
VRPGAAGASEVHRSTAAAGAGTAGELLAAVQHRERAQGHARRLGRPRQLVEVLGERALGVAEQRDCPRLALGPRHPRPPLEVVGVERDRALHLLARGLADRAADLTVCAARPDGRERADRHRYPPATGTITASSSPSRSGAARPT